MSAGRVLLQTINALSLCLKKFIFFCTVLGMSLKFTGRTLLQRHTLVPSSAFCLKRCTHK